MIISWAFRLLLINTMKSRAKKSNFFIIFLIRVIFPVNHYRTVGWLTAVTLRAQGYKDSITMPVFQEIVEEVKINFRE